jgi:V8-like Glu-specific endopeptidase
MRWRMRLVARRARGAFLLSLLTAAVFGAVLLLPATSGTAQPGNASAVETSRGPGGLTPALTPTAGGAGQPFGGIAQVGALFTWSAGKLGAHFCTAAVVDSAQGDLVVTAAHCMTGRTGETVFVPGYAGGKEPYGVWPVTAVYTDQAWQSSQDPDDDFAFLRLGDSGGTPVEDVTGGERVGTSSGTVLVQVAGYPDGAAQPILCASWTKIYSATQLEFDCDGYTDGSSGGPFLAGISAVSGQGTIIGVIGGYEQGGDTPDVSYAAAFGPAVTALFRSVQAG